MNKLSLFFCGILIGMLLTGRVFDKQESSIINNIPDYKVTEVIFTAYTSHIWQTDDTPDITASGSRVSFQTLALSRDLIKTYNENGIVDYGDTVIVVLIKPMIVEDTMNKRFRNRGDIWTANFEEAVKFGITKGFLLYRGNG